MKVNTNISLSKYTTSPILVLLLLGCGTTNNIKDNSNLSIKKDTLKITQSINKSYAPVLYINDGKKIKYDRSNQLDIKKQSTENWKIIDDTPGGAYVKAVENNGEDVILLNGADDMQNAFALRQVDGSYINIKSPYTVKWDSKFYDDFIVYIVVKLDDESIKYLSFSPKLMDNHSNVLTFKLPDVTKDGVWTTTNIDLNSTLHTYCPNKTIDTLIDFQVRGKGCIGNVSIDSNDDLNTSEPKTDEEKNYFNDFNLTITTDYTINVSSKVTINGQGTNIDQDALSKKLTEDLQTNLNLLLAKAISQPSSDNNNSNVQIMQMMKQFEEQFATMLQLLITIQNNANQTNSSTADELALFNRQLKELMELLIQMKSSMTNPSNNIPVDIQALMDQFQKNIEPIMSIIPQMFALADKGMDMVNPEKYIPSMMKIAKEIMSFSKYLVDTTAELIKDPNVDHKLYVDAMLKLSDDIGVMADRILLMADKILVMGDKMKEVAEKMIDMMGTTQANLLKAQENFNALLLGLAGKA
jgi:hypothetical protein